MKVKFKRETACYSPCCSIANKMSPHLHIPANRRTFVVFVSVFQACTRLCFMHSQRKIVSHFRPSGAWRIFLRIHHILWYFKVHSRNPSVNCYRDKLLYCLITFACGFGAAVLLRTVIFMASLMRDSRSFM